jgi:CO/xanthine dehydrogenase Mo-binding subunit
LRADHQPGWAQALHRGQYRTRHQPDIVGGACLRSRQGDERRLAPLPILDITKAPEAIDIVLINRPDLPPAGTGESSIRPVAAAIANAVFDATGVRLRRAPLTPERLKPALA